MGTGFCSLYREIHYIEVRYIKVWVYYIILDSPRGSVLKYRRLVVLELGIHAFFILFFQVRSFLQKNEYTKVYWWIVLSYFVSPRKMGRNTHLGFFLATNTITISLRCRPLCTKSLCFWATSWRVLYIFREENRYTRTVFSLVRIAI